MGDHEIVRSSALPSQLTLQLILGNAIEAAYLVDAKIELLDGEREMLRAAASAIDAGGRASQEAVHHAVPETSFGIYTAAEIALSTPDEASLRSQLGRLAESLRALAEDREPELTLTEVIEQLTALRSVLSATSAVRPDEVRGLLPVR